MIDRSIYLAVFLRRLSVGKYGLPLVGIGRSTSGNAPFAGPPLARSAMRYAKRSGRAGGQLQKSCEASQVNLGAQLFPSSGRLREPRAPDSSHVKHRGSITRTDRQTDRLRRELAEDELWPSNNRERRAGREKPKILAVAAAAAAFQATSSARSAAATATATATATAAAAAAAAGRKPRTRANSHQSLALRSMLA